MTLPVNDALPVDSWPSGSFVPLRGFCLPLGYHALASEVDSAFSSAHRRDFVMHETGGSLRHMSNLSSSEVRELCPSIWSLYDDERVTQLIEAHTGARPSPIHDDVESVVINYLHRGGDSHGNHLDDHEVAFVIVLDAPAIGAGGEVTFEDGGQHHSFHFAPGDAYIMRAGVVPHQVQPITSGRRVAAVMAFDLEGRPQPRRTTTASRLYALNEELIG